MPIRVAIETSGWFRLTDEAIERCIALGMTLAPSGDEKAYPGFDFYPFSGMDGLRYWSRSGGMDKSFRTNPVLIRVLEEMGDSALVQTWEDIPSTFKIIEIHFDGTDGWEIRTKDCSEGEYIEEDHRTWS